ncbi:hypothetical protein BCR44DRAFT_1439474 [Catenaria anguillulae PL171]|uniref:RNA polymerase II subunit A C-terminal domain phosphatase n=1 Tax=Catenaria anguillulae PL171 TaxID=765915 RepID=A0A1Y2HE83_9FUNG|nr:hypothetical protein BCR44DRAFT_1439474 [Catenaria anguillulae PL171]
MSTFQYKLEHPCVHIHAILHQPDAGSSSAAVTKGDPVLRIERAVPDSSDLDQEYPFRAKVPDSDPPLALIRDVIRAPVGGNLALLVKEGDMSSEGDVLFEIAPDCLHPVQYFGLCTSCGKQVSSDDDAVLSSGKQLSMVHDNAGITVSSLEARAIDAETTSRLRSEKKLSLILDLDQTLIHATADTAVGQWLDSQKEPVKGVHRFRLPNDPREYYLRLRPFLEEFLAGVSELYELHIYTMGSRAYANQVAILIDPKREFFKERILSRDESGSFERKSLQRLFPCDQSMVVAIDDRGDVWGWAENLIRVFPYKTTPNIPPIVPPPSQDPPSTASSGIASPAASMGPPKPIPGRLPVIKDDQDRELHILLRKLQELHGRFYQESTPDVRTILPHMKRKVLANCVISFSGLISKQAREELSDFWMLATTFGARCVKEITQDTTHLIAKKWGTDKGRAAYRLGIPIVHDGWLTTSVALWKKADEAAFAIIPPAGEADQGASMQGVSSNAPTDEAESDAGLPPPPPPISEEAAKNLADWNWAEEIAAMVDPADMMENDDEELFAGDGDDDDGGSFGDQDDAGELGQDDDFDLGSDLDLGDLDSVQDDSGDRVPRREGQKRKRVLRDSENESGDDDSSTHGGVKRRRYDDDSQVAAGDDGDAESSLSLTALVDQELDDF